MKAAGVHILEERRRFADIEKQNVYVSGIKNVAKSGAAPRFQRNILQARFFRNFIEGSITIIAVQKQRLTKTWSGFQAIDLRIDVAIGDQNVQPGIVVHIKKRGAPTDIGIT